MLTGETFNQRSSLVRPDTSEPKRAAIAARSVFEGEEE